jgi:hypothetical protein
MNQNKSQAAKKAWERPESLLWRLRIAARSRERMKELWKQTEFRAASAERMKAQHADPSFKEALKSAMNKRRIMNRKEISCIQCGKKFEITINCDQQFCGRSCSIEGYIPHNKKHPLPKTATRAEVERWRYKNDPAFRLRFILKRKMQRFISGQKTSGAMERLLGCSLDQLRAHIESQFRHGMDWGNQGTGIGRWQIDHILPQSIFSPTFEQQMICWNWQNLRPIWGTENAKKGSRIIPGKSQLPLPICHF